MRLPACLTALLLAFCALLPTAARAQSSAGVYTVADVRVDQTAANAVEAKTIAFGDAQRIAFARLVERLAPPADFARLGVPAVTPLILERLALGVDVQEERRSGARYIARLAVNFNPQLVRQVLAEAGYTTLTESRAAPTLVAPVLAGAAGAFEQQWLTAWREGAFDRELAPLVIASDVPAVAEPSWEAIQPAAAAAGAVSAVFVMARAEGGRIVADLVEVGPNGQRIERGRVSAPVAAGGGGFPEAFRQVAQAVNSQIQGDWKARLAQGPAPSARINVQALYADLTQWLRLKRVLESAGRTLVNEVRIDALSREGALVSVGYVGALEQLQAEIARSGGALEAGPGGYVLRLAGSR